MTWRRLQTQGLWPKLLPLLVLLTFSSSEARFALSHTLEQLFPPQACLDHCPPQTTAPKTSSPQQMLAIQGGSSAALPQKAGMTLRAHALRVGLELPAPGLPPRIEASALPRAPPRANLHT
ncbi:MAG: hypothetical protein SFU83_17405 [Meiothermus sp.]|nr:hypothetical protein [Meiothermus sp.]